MMNDISSNEKTRPDQIDLDLLPKSRLRRCLNTRAQPSRRACTAG